jgi:hypothetical protein
MAKTFSFWSPRDIQTPGAPNVAVGALAVGVLAVGTLAVGATPDPQAMDVANSNVTVKNKNPLRFNGM